MLGVSRRRLKAALVAVAAAALVLPVSAAPAQAASAGTVTWVYDDRANPVRPGCTWSFPYRNCKNRDTYDRLVSFSNSDQALATQVMTVFGPYSRPHSKTGETVAVILEQIPRMNSKQRLCTSRRTEKSLYAMHQAGADADKLMRVLSGASAAFGQLNKMDQKKRAEALYGSGSRNANLRRIATELPGLSHPYFVYVTAQLDAGQILGRAASKINANEMAYQTAMAVEGC